MANSLSNNIFHKTIELHEQRDPYRNLWRNVLIVGIEDLLKKKEIQIKFDVKQKYSLEEMWFNHEDFDLVCEYSQLSPKIVKDKIIKALKVMEKKYVKKNNLSEMQGKWFYKTNELNRRSDGSYTPMSAV